MNNMAGQLLLPLSELERLSHHHLHTKIPGIALGSVDVLRA